MALDVLFYVDLSAETEGFFYLYSWEAPPEDYLTTGIDTPVLGDSFPSLEFDLPLISAGWLSPVAADLLLILF